LVAASRSQARVAMELQTDPMDTQSRLKAAMAVGVAVELALKAAVASILPSLLADKGDPHSQLFLMGRAGLPGKSQSDVRTIGGTAAWQVISAVRPQIDLSQKDVQAALNLRNGAVHLALVDPTELAAGIRAMAICVDRLLSEFITRRDYWGEEFEDQVLALIKEVMDAREIRVEQAKSSALVQLARLRALGEEAFDAVVVTLDSEGREPEDNGESYGEPHECPVCGYSGWLSGVVERSDLQMDEADPHEVWVDRVFVPREFRCEVCGLAVWDQDLPMAGLPAAMQLEADNDPWELREMYEDIQADIAFEAMREARF